MAAICFCWPSIAASESNVLTTVPQLAHYKTGTARNSLRGVIRQCSKTCPSHFAQVEIAIAGIIANQDTANHKPGHRGDDDKGL